MIYIYIIINVTSKKVYIGSTNDVIGRFSKHKRDLNNDTHHNEHLQNAWNKYGFDSFEFKTLMVCPDSERNYYEQMFIDLYDAQNHNFGYNIKDADGHSVSEETKLKISENNAKYWKGKNLSNEHRQKISKSLKLGGKMKHENNPQWKDYARIIKAGFYKNKQRYKIKFNSKNIKESFYIFKLIDWFFENYPNEDLEISMEVLDNALLS